MAVPPERAAKYDEALTALAAAATYVTTFSSALDIQTITDEAYTYLTDHGANPGLGAAVEASTGWWTLTISGG
jgi:hypothetical protein